MSCVAIHHLCSMQVDFFERQINRYLLIQSGLPEEGRRCQHKTKKMMSFVMFLMVAQSSSDYHGKEMTVYLQQLCWLCSTQIYQSHYTVWWLRSRPIYKRCHTSHISKDQKAWWVSRWTLVTGCLSKQRMNSNNINNLYRSLSSCWTRALKKGEFKRI